MVASQVPLRSKSDDEERHDGRVNTHAKVGHIIDHDRCVDIVQTEGWEPLVEEVERKRRNEANQDDDAAPLVA